jgi:hypothetical protein
MAQNKYKVWLCNKDWTKILLLNPFNVQYSYTINKPNQAYFELSQHDPALVDNDVDFDSNVYRVQIVANDAIRWKGTIDELTSPDNGSALDKFGLRASGRLSDFYDLIIDADDDTYVRNLSGKLGDLAEEIFTECQSRYNSPISDLSVGTIENPLDSTGTEITLTEDLYMMSLYDIINLLATIGNADFYIDDENGTFNFVKNKGIASNVMWKYVEGYPGNDIIDIRPTNDLKVYNHLIGVGEGEGINKNTCNQMDTASITKFNLRERLIAERIIENSTTMNLYLKKILSRTKEPFAISQVALRRTQHLFDGYSIGDTLRLKIKSGIWNIDRRVRLLGVTVYVNDQNVETIIPHLDLPKEEYA